MELGTHLKPHILSVQMTVKRSSGTFLGESPVCFQALGLVLERDQRLATMLGFSCPAPWFSTCNKPIPDQGGCSSSSNHTFIPTKRREEEQGNAHLSNHKTILRKSRTSAHTRFGRTFVTRRQPHPRGRAPSCEGRAQDSGAETLCRSRGLWSLLT